MLGATSLMGQARLVRPSIGLALAAGALGIGLGHLVPQGGAAWVALGGLSLAGAQVLDWPARRGRC